MAEAETKQIMLRLLREEDQLRREQLECASRHQCECSIAMQQQKLAAIDDLSERLSSSSQQHHHHHHNVTSSSAADRVTLSGPNVSGSVTVITSSKLTSPVQDPPITVDELLDSLHSTPI